MTKPTGRPRGRPRKHPKPQDVPADALAITTAPTGEEGALVEADSMRTAYRRMRLRQDLEGLFSHGVLSYRPTELFRKAIVEGDTERARMIVEMAPDCFPAQVQELAELAREHLRGESEPAFREGTSDDLMAKHLEARRKIQRGTPKRRGLIGA